MLNYCQSLLIILLFVDPFSIVTIKNVGDSKVCSTQPNVLADSSSHFELAFCSNIFLFWHRLCQDVVEKISLVQALIVTRHEKIGLMCT